MIRIANACIYLYKDIRLSITRLLLTASQATIARTQEPTSPIPGKPCLHANTGRGRSCNIKCSAANISRDDLVRSTTCYVVF